MKTYGEIVKKKFSEYYLFALVFIAGIILHYIAGDFPKRIDCVPDEVKYFSIARNLFFHRGLYVRGVNTAFQKILYSLAISPLFGIDDHLLRIKAINLLNCIMMGSSSIPLLLISKELNLSKKYTYFILIVFILWPETFITATFMSESLYWPFAFWFVYLCIKNEHHVSILTTVIMSIVCYLGYTNKEVFMAYFVAYILSELWEIRRLYKGQGSIKEHILKLVVFTFVFVLIHIILKCTLFRGLGNSYANQIGIREVLNPKCILYILYAFLYYIVSCAVVLTIAPVTFVFLFRKNFDDLANKLLRMLVLTLTIIIAGIAYSISAREDLFSLCPRLHIRYFGPVLFLLIFMFILACQHSEKKMIKELNNKFMLITVLFFAASVLVFRGATNGSAVDYFSFSWYQALSGGSENTFVLSVIIVFIMLTVTFILWTNSVQKGKPVLIISILITTILFSDFIACKDLRMVYAMTDDEVKEMQEMSDYISLNCKNEENILYFSEHDNVVLQTIIDTYIDRDVIFTDASELERMFRENAITLYEPISHIVYDGIDSIDYIILNSQYDAISIPANWEIEYQNSMYKMFKTNITFSQGTTP